MKKILAYSAIKISANLTAPNSTLNPDTSSDSPSAKSNGVRFVSAKQEMSHTPAKGIKTKILKKYRLAQVNSTKLKDLIKPK